MRHAHDSSVAASLDAGKMQQAQDKENKQAYLSLSDGTLVNLLVLNASYVT